MSFKPGTGQTEVYRGQDHFDIPRALVAVRAARDNRIRQDRAEGATHRELALRYQITERHVRNIIGEEFDVRQTGLF